MTKLEALDEINKTQDYYVDRLVDIIKKIDNRFDNFKEIDFTSPTGTGKTIMMSKLINKLPDYFFVVTSLSKGQLRYQIESTLRQNIKEENNLLVFGLNEYTKNTIRQADDIIALLPSDKPIIWLRDEGHIATNRWQGILREKSSYIINFSATNKTANGIQCNFTHTMMLRTIKQQNGTPSDALNQLARVKEMHKTIKEYNPCALFRLMDEELTKKVIDLCNDRGYKVINITDEDFDMADLCRDNNEYDVIINKFKITEGIDLKRCHVIYMDNKPGNESTVVQIIGRARRNALLWRDDIDILSEENRQLLYDTRQSFVFYNIPETQINQNENGELAIALCDTISIENLKPNVEIVVEQGKLLNGLSVIELKNRTGKFKITYDSDLECNVVNNATFYNIKQQEYDPFIIDLSEKNLSIKKIFVSNNIKDFFKLKEKRDKRKWDYAKYLFFAYESYSLNKGIPFDSQYWRQYLEIDKKDKAVSSNRWYYFSVSIYKNAKYDDIKKYIEKLSVAERSRMFEESLFEGVSIFDASKEIIEEGYLPRIRKDLYPFVRSFEAVCTKKRDYIDSKINEILRVEKINNDKYLVSNYPRTCYLSNIASFNDLKQRINNNKKTFYGVPAEEWKKVVSRISSLAELDQLGAHYVNLQELNKIFKLNFTEQDIREYVNCDCPVKKYSKSALRDYCIQKYDKHEQAYVYVRRPKYTIYKSDFDNTYVPYTKTINDREIATIGPDIMKYCNNGYIEDTAVTSKIGQFCKFNRFINLRYQKILDTNRKHFYSKKSDLGLDKKSHSCLGICVEYYAKIKIYGEAFFERFIKEAQAEAKKNIVDDVIIVRASFLAYRDLMCRVYGTGVGALIPSISINQLIQNNYSKFVKLVVKYGKRTESFVRSVMGYDTETIPEKLYDPDLSVNHISALCDFINENTIIDIKCTNEINERYLKQILAYHYLSTKRTDLKISHLVIFDAIANKCLKIDI